MENDVKKYEYKRLIDIARIERAVKGKIYPAGTILIALSATRGDIEILDEESTVESRYATIELIDGYIPYYIYLSITNRLNEFLYKYQTGINLQKDELKHLVIQVHNMETQKAITKAIAEIDKSIEEEEIIINLYKEMKKTNLSQMFV